MHPGLAPPLGYPSSCNGGALPVHKKGANLYTGITGASQCAPAPHGAGLA